MSPPPPKKVASMLPLCSGIATKIFSEPRRSTLAPRGVADKGWCAEGESSVLGQITKVSCTGLGVRVRQEPSAFKKKKKDFTGRDYKNRFTPKAFSG